MKKNLSLKTLFLLCFLLSWSGINAYSDCAPECCDQVYDCGDPLNCGSINFLVHGGVAPTLWRNRGDFSLVSCNALNTSGIGQTVVKLFELPKFSKFFHVPWIVGGQIGYALTDHIEVYLEANYRSSKAKNFVLNNVVLTPFENGNVSFVFQNSYRVIDAYVGARYYWGRCWCDRVAFFLGGKFGLVHHQPVNFQFLIVQQTCPIGAPLSSNGNTPLFLRNTVPAVGANFGFDWCIGCGWSVVLMGEVVAANGPKSNANIVVPNSCTGGILPALLPTNILIGNIETELFFPVTLGLKYSF